MSRVTPVSAKKRKLEDAMRGKTSKPRKRIKKQKNYHSSSSEDEQEEETGFAPVSLADSDAETEAVARPTKQKSTKAKTTEPNLKPKKSKKRPEKPQQQPETSDDEEQSNNSDSAASDEDQNASGTDQDTDQDHDHSTNKKRTKPKSKRNDPTAFATSITKILSTKLPSKAADPLLAHSREVAQTRAAESSSRLEAKATSRLRAEKAAALQKGRTRDPSGVERGIAGQVAQEEKDLRRIAQRGVVQLFNAFRAAHVRAEEARKEERTKGTIGMGEREKRAAEMGKSGFLERIAGGRKAGATVEG